MECTVSWILEVTVYVYVINPLVADDVLSGHALVCTQPSMMPLVVIENNKSFLQKWLRYRDSIKSTETSCHTAKQYLAVGHTCKGVAPYPYIWQHGRSCWQNELQSHFIKRHNIVLLASAFYRSGKFFTTTALHTISYRQQIAMQGRDACVANVRFTVMQLPKGQRHSKVSSQM